MATRSPQSAPNAKLKRVDLVVPTEASLNDSATLAEKAATLLGYSGNMVRKNVAGVLGKVLIDLDIRPYDIARVAAYKEKKRKAAHAERRAVTPSYQRIVSRWLLIPISRYKSMVPEFVLRKAVQIKEACPTALIYVDALKVNTRPFPDPFLVVKLGNEKYWVDVWDEAAFESEVIDSND